MKTTTTIVARPPRMTGAQILALLAGMVVIGATVAILAGDALTGGTWGQDQWLGLVILAATISFGLLRKRACTEKKWASAVAFAALFGLGSALLVYSSMGRQEAARADRVQGAKNVKANNANLRSEQARLDSDIARLNGELKRYAGVRSPVEVQAALDGIVGSAANKVPTRIWRRTRSCAADETTRPDSAAACRPAFDLRIENGKAIEKARIEHDIAAKEGERSAIVAKLQSSGGEQIVVGKAATFAELASLLGFDKASVERIVSRVDILLITIFLELSAIAALEYAFAGLMTACPATVAQQAATADVSKATVLTVTTVANDDRPPQPPRGGNRCQSLDGNRVATRAAAEADVIRLVSRGERLPAQDVLARRWAVHKGTASKWLADFEKRGLIARTCDGRAKVISAA